jgi:hypothetical protein
VYRKVAQMKKLSDYGRNVYSQFGEDGIIEQIFKILGTSSKVCVEFGAWDGFYLSNTANLWTKGWKGILIEADKNRYKSLVQNVKKYDCHCINAFVRCDGLNTLENILKQNGISGDVDLLSIDVDGDDYYILESLRGLKPRLVVCEFNPTIPPSMDLIPEKGNYFGCSPFSLVKLAETKGYRLIAASDANCFFVRAEDFEKFADYENNLELLVNKKHLTYFITGFDGDYILSNKPVYGPNYPSTQKFRGKYYRFRRNLLRTFYFFIKRILGVLGIRIQGFDIRKKTL